MRIQLAFAAVVLLLTGVFGNAVADTKVYRYVDEKGVVTYSETPPPSAKGARQVHIQDNQIGSPEEAAEARAKAEELHRESMSRVESRLEEIANNTEQIEAARRSVAERKDALEKGRVPLPGERKALVSGYTRLRPEYFERVKQLEADLAAAEARLNELLDKR